MRKRRSSRRGFRLREQPRSPLRPQVRASQGKVVGHRSRKPLRWLWGRELHLGCSLGGTGMAVWGAKPSSPTGGGGGRGKQHDAAELLRTPQQSLHPPRRWGRVVPSGPGRVRGAAGSLRKSGAHRRVRRHWGPEALNLESQQENEAKGEEKKREMERARGWGRRGGGEVKSVPGTLG